MTLPTVLSYIDFSYCELRHILFRSLWRWSLVRIPLGTWICVSVFLFPRVSGGFAVDRSHYQGALQMSEKFMSKNNSELEQGKESNSWWPSKKEHSHTHAKTLQRLTRIIRHILPFCGCCETFLEDKNRGWGHSLTQRRWILRRLATRGILEGLLGTQKFVLKK